MGLRGERLNEPLGQKLQCCAFSRLLRQSTDGHSKKFGTLQLCSPIDAPEGLAHRP